MSKPSIEYAQALYALATENECYEDFEKDLDLIKTVLDENPDYITLLSCVSVPKEERLDMIAGAFGDAVSGDIVSFLKLMCERNRISDLPECIEEYKKMLRTLNKSTKAKVLSAVELMDEQKTALSKKLEKISGKNVIVDYLIDDSILGGLIVEIDGKIMDSSLQRHLNNVKDVIKG